MVGVNILLTAVSIPIDVKPIAEGTPRHFLEGGMFFLFFYTFQQLA